MLEGDDVTRVTMTITHSTLLLSKALPILP